VKRRGRMRRHGKSTRQATQGGHPGAPQTTDPGIEVLAGPPSPTISSEGFGPTSPTWPEAEYGYSHLPAGTLRQELKLREQASKTVVSALEEWYRTRPVEPLHPGSTDGFY
jgi:hypothetical protein